ncbi:ATP-binding protein [Yoonia sp.]|uniref:ATP-binding protein n=1 Tax=Yoonia sp. TaxID=2212373 RepID=UPI003F4A933D
MQNDLDAVDALVVALCQQVGDALSPAAMVRFEICMSEALTNVVKHAAAPAFAVIDIDATTTPAAILIEIFDYDKAPPFDPRDHAVDLDTLDPLAESGRGIGLILQCADAVNYSVPDGRARLSLTFEREQPKTGEPE